MKKIVAMIPARAGSKRIPKKNIRLINGKPLIQYIIDSAVQSNVFSEIFVNTDDSIIKEFVLQNYPSVKVFNRKTEFASDTATNDDFAADFLTNTECDTIIQLLPTSPFVSPELIRNFAEEFVNKGCDTLVSLKKNQIECIYKEAPLNFDNLEHTLPSQQLEPVYSYACSLMAWDKQVFLENYKGNSGAYHGGKGHTGYFTITGEATIDIDNEDDFMLAEIVAKKLEAGAIQNKPEYYSFKVSEIKDADRERVLNADGVRINNLHDYNKLFVNVDEIRKKMGSDKSWSYAVINTLSNCATLIAQLPGEGNRRHYHNNWDEWWIIIDGEWEYEYNREKYKIKKGDIILIQRNNVHKITAIGDKQAIRLAVSREDVDHIYTPEDYR